MLDQIVSNQPAQAVAGPSRYLWAVIGSLIPLLAQFWSMEAAKVADIVKVVSVFDPNVIAASVKFVAAIILALIAAAYYSEIMDISRLMILGAGAPSILLGAVNINSINESSKSLNFTPPTEITTGAPKWGASGHASYDVASAEWIYVVQVDTDKLDAKIIKRSPLAEPVDKPTGWDQFVAAVTGSSTLAPHMVIVGSVLTDVDANRAGAEIKRMLSADPELAKLDLYLYAPYRQSKYMAIGVGPWVSVTEAKRLQAKVVQMGITDAFVRRVSDEAVAAAKLRQGGTP